MRFLQDIASMLFIVAVEVLAIVSVLGIWKVFGNDVIEKSVMTLMLLMVVTVVVIIAGRFVEHRSAQDSALPPPVPNPLFKTTRQLTLGILIACATLLALLGVLSIWEVIADKEVLYRSLGTLAVLAFAAFVIVLACLERERIAIFKKESAGWTWGSIVGVLFLLWIVSNLVGLLRYL